MNLSRLYNVHDLREAARRRLPRGFFEYVDRGAEDEVALAANRAAFERIKLNHRVIVDVSTRDTSIELFGERWAMPVAIAPTGSAALAWYEGEMQLARGAKSAGIPFTLSGGASIPMERVVGELGPRGWFQVYLMEDEGLNRQIFERAAAAGIQVLIVTADSVVSPIREYNDRNGFTIPFRITPRNTVDVLMHPRWFVGVILRYLATRGLPRYANMPVEMRDAITGRPARMVINSSLDWDGFLRLRKLWPNRLLLKGVMTAADARLAADHGVDGVVVSNHGGRNFDAAMATIDALPDIVDAVGHRIPVLLDSGIRRGSDVVKALALGARAVLAGRLPLYGAAVAGQAGVERALSILRNEFEVAMAFCGRSRAADIDRSILASE